MNKNFKRLNPEKKSSFFSVLILFTLIVINFSCENKPDSLGADLIPEGDRIGVDYDTLLTFDSFLTDTTHYNTQNKSDYSIGNFQDPHFGELIGSYAGQFVPSQFFVTDEEFLNKFTDVSIDSAYLMLSINDFYGAPHDSSDVYVSDLVDLKVYELNTSISDIEFQSNSDITEYYSTSDLISSETKEIQITGDSVIIFLKESFYSKLIDPYDNFYDSTEMFLEKFNGIAIIPEEPTGDGGLYNFNVAASNIKFFYQEDDTTTLEFKYFLNAGQRIGQYSIDYTGAEINNYNDPETPSEFIFLQGLGGMQSKLVFSNYISLFNTDSVYSIHNAELTIPVFQDALFDECPPPERLFFYSDTNYTVIEDVDNSSLFNGYYNDETKEYVFNISKYVKDLLNGNIDDPTLYFTISDWILYPNRVILKAEDNIKLRVTYTKH